MFMGHPQTQRGPRSSEKWYPSPNPLLQQGITQIIPSIPLSGTCTSEKEKQVDNCRRKLPTMEPRTWACNISRQIYLEVRGINLCQFRYDHNGGHKGLILWQEIHFSAGHEYPRTLVKAISDPITISPDLPTYLNADSEFRV